MLLTIPRPGLVEIDLEPELVLGGAVANGTRRASVGVPQVIPLRREHIQAGEISANTVDFHRFDFYLVLLSCSLGAAEGETIESATVAVDLQTDFQSSQDPIAWSLAPLRLAERPLASHVSAAVEVKLGPMLKISGNWAPADRAQACYVHALGEGDSDPEWRYRATTPERLLGVHDMTMVVRLPAGTQGIGAVRISARAGRPGFWRTRVALLPQRVRTFVVSHE